jgi:hypothetical protein
MARANLLCRVAGSEVNKNLRGKEEPEGIGGKIPSPQEDGAESHLAPTGVDSHRAPYFPLIVMAMRWTSSGLFRARSWLSPLAWG